MEHVLSPVFKGNKYEHTPFKQSSNNSKIGIYVLCVSPIKSVAFPSIGKVGGTGRDAVILFILFDLFVQYNKYKLATKNSNSRIIIFPGSLT